MKRIVFAGPSLHHEDRRADSEIEFRAPARKGDLLIAARDGAAIIGLVDGYFETAPSVWHKEILFCLSQGIVVAGAASMGALRAAECAAFGMVGLGRIFEDYHSGRRNADADVAVLHAPAELGHIALTLALVDAELTLERMRAEGVISALEAEAGLAAARQLHFKDRSWESIFAIVADSGVPSENMRHHLAQFRVDQKRQDCRELLDHVRAFHFEAESSRDPGFVLQNTAFLSGLLQSVQARRNVPREATEGAG